MKQSLQNLQNLASDFGSAWLGFANKIGIVASLCLVASFANAQDCNVVMACNDGIQVSLDENCEAEITPDLMLEGAPYPNSFYTVQLRDPLGAIITGTTVNGSHVGQIIEVRVSLNNCDLTCWGSITIEDKLPPVITACADITVDCTDSTSPGSPGVTRPTAVDACTSVTYAHFDTFEDLACSEEFGRIITRTWVASDTYGNADTCVQMISVNRARLADVTFPPNYDDQDQPSFKCDTNIPLLSNGAPNPTFTGFPTGVECPNIQYYYTDVVFDLCGASVKVLRQWFIIDWCSGEEITMPQIIKIIDDAPPVCAAANDDFFSIENDPGLCSGTFDVPAPNVIFECSDWTYIVGYKLRDANGNPFQNPIYDGIITNADGSFSIPGLPMDTTWIVYTITDDCGNETQCFTEVYINDTEAPTPVCEGFTTVSVDQTGWADVFATSLDDNSWDNCDIDRFEVKRNTTNCTTPEDLVFGEAVNFCCEDVANSPIKVTMRVYDRSGNFNDCIVNVTVQDKKAPVVISCPDNVVLQCGQDPSDMTLTGDNFIAEDNCSLEITSVLSGSLNDCGTGTFRRRWTATDPQGRTASCTQTITVRDDTPFVYDDIEWPNDETLNGCSTIDADPETLGSLPIITNADCSNIAISYEDDVFYNTPGVCVKVLRKWRVANWCASTQGNDFFEYTQKIELTNLEAPVFVSGCDGGQFDPSTGACDADVTVSVSATDDCTAPNEIKYSYTIDLFSNNSVDFTGNTKNFNRTLPSGMHRVTFTAEDKCGLSTDCSFIVRVSDDKPPTPICLGEVIWVIDENGNAEIWASDFNLKSTDDCSPDESLIYAFNSSGTEQVRTYTCADIPNGIGEVIMIDMYVIDPDGNSSFCEVKLILQDNSGDYCQDQDARAAVGGQIINNEGDALESIEVELMNSTMAEESVDMTETDGAYMFDDVNYYDSYVISPENNENTGNGVSTLDLVLIQRHILGISEFTSPFQYIAADINKSSSLSGADVVELRKIILGKQVEFKSNTSWRFMDSRHEFLEIEYPYNFPEAVNLNELYVDQENVNFVGIKIGDVNNTATSNVNSEDLAENRGAGIEWTTANQNYVAGQTVEINLNAGQDQFLSGLQFTLDFGQNLMFKGLKEGSIITSNNIASIDNSLAVSLDAVNGIQLRAEQAVITLIFEAVGTGSLSEDLAMGSDILSAEAYDINANVMDLQLDLRSEDNNGLEYGLTLSQNVPNPFNETTTINYSIDQDSDVKISFYDISGRLLNEQSSFKSAGSHQTIISKEDLNVEGLIYYRLEANGQSLTKKMIIIE